MEESSRNGRRFRVHREFECSRLEQAMLAAAYRKILPNDCLKLVERYSTTIDRCNGEGQPVVDKDANLSLFCATAMGGPS